MQNKMERSFIELLEDSDKSSSELYKELKYSFRNKGYGNRKEELSFFKEFFSLFFEKQYDVFQVEWVQYQDYNDNWYYYDIQELKINQYLDIHFSGFDDRDENNWDYIFTGSDSGVGDIDDIRKYHAKLEREYKHLRKHVDKLFVFLRCLYDYYGGYYFIYVFGSRAKVSISKDGINIDSDYEA
jgi:hypothetical protein